MRQKVLYRPSPSVGCPCAINMGRLIITVYGVFCSHGFGKFIGPSLAVLFLIFEIYFWICNKFKYMFIFKLLNIHQNEYFWILEHYLIRKTFFNFMNIFWNCKYFLKSRIFKFVNNFRKHEHFLNGRTFPEFANIFWNHEYFLNSEAFFEIH